MLPNQRYLPISWLHHSGRSWCCVLGRPCRSRPEGRLRNYLSPLAEAREIASKGFGSFAVSPIPIGTIVAVFGGTTLNRINFETYPLEQRSRSIQIDVNQFVLGPELRESGDSINHSCLPKLWNAQCNTTHRHGSNCCWRRTHLRLRHERHV